MFKAFVCAVALVAANPVLARGVGGYQFQVVPHDQLDDVMTIGSDATGTPENLQGLWWMDGNPLADEVVSFAGAQYEAIEEDDEVVGYSAEIAVYDEAVWTWHNSFGGHLLYRLVNQQKLVYHGIFNADFTHGEVTPIIRPFSVLPEVEIPQSMLVNFSMTQVTEDEWSRDSVLFGQSSSYRFRRIVDGEGNRLPAWDDFVQSIEDRNVGQALLPVCKNSDGVLPSPCVK